MGVTREDLIRTGRWLKEPDDVWERQKASVQQAVDGYMGNDAWASKIKKNVGVLLIGHASGRPYLKASIESHIKLGYWLTLSYDNFLDPERAEHYDLNDWLPAKDVLVNVDTFMIPHHQTWGGVSYPYMWQLRLASGILHSFEYVYCANADCVVEKPEGFPQLLDMMGDADIMSAGPTLPREIGTAAFICRRDALMRISKHMVDHVVPFSEYEKSTQDFGNTEGRLAVACRELGLKVKAVPKEPSCPKHPVCEQQHVPGGTFYDVIGFRHIHGEHNYAHRYRAIPPTTEYLDGRYMGDEYRIIQAYHELKASDPEAAVKLLEGWWHPD